MTPPDADPIGRDVLAILRRVCRKPVELAAHSALAADLGFDSLQTLEFVAEFEDRFGITVPIEQVPKIQTVAEAITCVRSLLAEKPVPDGACTPFPRRWPPPPGPAAVTATWPRTGATSRAQPFARLLDEALAVAGGLREAGISRGETVALIVPGAREFLTAFLGAACAASSRPRFTRRSGPTSSRRTCGRRRLPSGRAAPRPS